MIKINADSGVWRKTAKSRLHFELAGLAFAHQRGFSSEDYAQHLWSTGSVRWMGKAKPNAREYLLKEAEAFQRFYPDVAFKIVEAGDEKAGLVFTDGCLGGWGTDRWALTRRLSLAKADVCAYCRKSFLIWAEQLGLSAQIGPKNDTTCYLLVLKR